MQESSDSQPLRSTTYRVVTGGVGVLFIGVAVFIAVSPDLSAELGPLLAAIVIGVLGVDALLGGIRNTRSLISRIGPLP